MLPNRLKKCREAYAAMKAKNSPYIQPITAFYTDKVRKFHTVAEPAMDVHGNAFKFIMWKWHQLCPNSNYAYLFLGHAVSTKKKDKKTPASTHKQAKFCESF